MRPKLAIIGGGVSGICAAYLNQSNYDVSLFERNDYLGGHTNTFVIPSGPDAGIGIDTGFIVCNNWTYPLFLKFLKRLNVPTQDSDMSFGFYCEKTSFCYAGTNLNGLFAQRSNLVSGTFYRMLYDILRFNQEGESFLSSPDPSLNLSDFLKRANYSKIFINNYVLPLGASIWSTPAMQMLEFPALTILRFFKNHGLLSIYRRPQWMTVANGSHSYIKAFKENFNGRIILNAKVIGLERPNNANPLISFGNQEPESFDKIIVATHADQALKLLRDPTKEEAEALGPWRYQKNRVVLHTDESVLPPLKRAWASWNYVRESLGSEETHLSMTYHMNRLQGLKTKYQYCVSLNRFKEIPSKQILKEIDYTHPIYSLSSLRAQSLLAKLNDQLNGSTNTYFCGSYFGYGFHEDAVKAAVDLSEKLRGVL